MTRLKRALTGAALVLALGAGTAMAQDFSSWSCRDLWTERNQIYKDAGYCFQTRRAIATFGNAGCAYDRQADVPLSGQQRRIIAAIRSAERWRGCTD
ncbi:YARHG domain-containing protein [Phreatobacter sp.]|uniref:YARHG domain-containing protein n=1 Tax=Phreatobacter sp. TaxID=1966341 RepID=UPI003F728165